MSTVDFRQYCVYGQAEVDFGLCVQDGVNGAGLLTRGFIWQGPDIWYDQLSPISGYSIGTAWKVIAGYSTLATSWAAPTGYSALVTGWTASIFLNFGEFPSTQ